MVDRPLRPRINAAVAVLKDKIYIFGGYERFDEDGEGCKPCYHYSVLRLHTQTTPFRWVVEANEVPYSAPLPADFIVGEALPVLEDNQILLLPGRTTEEGVSACPLCEF